MQCVFSRQAGVVKRAELGDVRAELDEVRVMWGRRLNQQWGDLGWSLIAT